MLPNSEIEARVRFGCSNLILLARLRTLTSTIGSCTQKAMIDKSTVRGYSRRSNFVLIIQLVIIITGRGGNESELSQGSDARARGGTGYLGKCLLGMCRSPLRGPYPIIVYFLANYRPQIVTFWQM